MDAEKAQNLITLFFDRAAHHGDAPFLWAKKDGAYVSQSWAAVADDIVRLAQALKTLGIKPGDRVALVSENRPEWLVCDLAIMAAGAISVPAYTTNTQRDHLHILDNSQAKGVIVSTPRLAKQLLPAAHQADTLEFVLGLEPLSVSQSINARINHWSEVVAPEQPDLPALREAAGRIARNDTACLIYTSGTGGAPKGVRLHHGAILHNCYGAADVIKELGLEGNRFLSFLPLSHAYEHSAGQFFPISIGAEIYYAEGIDKLATNMVEVKPTVMVVVPRLFEALRTRVTRTVEKQGGLSAKLFHRAQDIGIKKVRAGERLSLAEKLQDPFLELVVRRKVRQRFGGQLRALVSGGAPLNPEVGEFFMAFGLPLLQGYGQTEAAPVVSVNRPSNPKTHTVGPPLKDVSVKIAEDGEILVKGELVMHGYWADDRATESTLKDGWLFTGDIGHIDEDGHLVITDRKKDLIVNDKGDNISPQRIEGMLALEPEISQAMVYGDRRPYLVGLVVPDPDWMKDWARANKKPRALEDLAEDSDFKAVIDEAVGRVNQRLSNLEKVRRVLIASEPFSIENEQMTPSMKIRRHVIFKKYGDRLAAFYG